MRVNIHGLVLAAVLGSVSSRVLAIDFMPPSVWITAPTLASAMRTPVQIVASDETELALRVSSWTTTRADSLGASSIETFTGTVPYREGVRFKSDQVTASVPLGSTVELQVVVTDLSGNATKRRVTINSPTPTILSGDYRPVGQPVVPQGYNCMDGVWGTQSNQDAISQVQVSHGGNEWSVADGYRLNVRFFSPDSSGSVYSGFAADVAFYGANVSLQGPSMSGFGGSISYETKSTATLSFSVMSDRANTKRITLRSQVSCKVNNGPWVEGTPFTIVAEAR